MRFAILCNDTRGGVQPYAALARGLVRAGHDVVAVCPAGLAGLFGPGMPVVALFGTEDATAALAGGLAERGTGAAMRVMARGLPARLAGWAIATRDACEGADVLIGGIGGMAIGLAAAEVLRLPFVPMHLQPVHRPAIAYPGVLLARLPCWVGPVGRRISHGVSDAAVWLPFRAAMRQVRRTTFGLKEYADPTAGQPRLYGFSRRVVPLPEDDLHRATGYWTLPADADWRPPADLIAFLDDPRPTVSIGFGSMGSADPALLGTLVAAAARQAGVRVIMLAGPHGWTAPQDEDVFVAGALPHGWLFPRMRANVHHGGAGTTAAALMAGKPSVVVPFAVDQPFWGARVAALGVGPAPIPRKALTAEALGTALRRVLEDRGMQDRSAELGSHLRDEDGVAVAVDALAGLPLRRRQG